MVFRLGNASKTFDDQRSSTTGSVFFTDIANYCYWCIDVIVLIQSDWSSFRDQGEVWKVLNKRCWWSACHLGCQGKLPNFTDTAVSCTLLKTSTPLAAERSSYACRKSLSSIYELSSGISLGMMMMMTTEFKWKGIKFVLLPYSEN